MSYQSRAIVGLLLIFASFGILFYISPARTGISAPEDVWVYGFIGLFALGFMLFSMGILGHQDAYTAFVSGFVLYLLVGGAITLTLYITGNGIHQYSLEDAANPAFWGEAMRLSILWPLTIVQLTGFWGWEAFNW
ncbi:MAG: hypothetical protein IT332_09685 [Ardenticatenales bacterium]|nr:hypothetical protein [Ardenticatenales bacterium]